MTFHKTLKSGAFYQGIKIALIYALIGSLWIIFSDRLPEIFSLPLKDELLYQSVKGIVYVVVSAGVIFFLVFRSFSDVEKINRQLEKSRKSYKRISDYQSAIIASSPVAIFDTDREGRVLSIWNESAEKIFNCKREEVLGRSFLDYLRVKEEDSATLLKAFTAGNTVSGTEIDGTTRNGDEKSLNISCSKITDKGETHERFLWVVMDETMKKKAERRIESSLKEKEMLLQEINHRVYNNLQTITSILSLQQEYMKHPEASEQLSESKNRILSLSMVHEEFYENVRKQGSGIEIGSYIYKLAQAVFLHYRMNSPNISIQTSIEPCVLSLEEAVPLGLLTREIVSNAFRHAFDSDPGGVVRIVLGREGNRFTLIIADNGKGLDDTIDFRGKNSLGFSLIDSLVKQLKYSMEISNEGGTTFIIRGSIPNG